jgi:hypothetical protein
LKLNLKEITKKDINFKEKLNIIDMSNLVVFKSVFSSPIKHLMKAKMCYGIEKNNLSN